MNEDRYINARTLKQDLVPVLDCRHILIRCLCL